MLLKGVMGENCIYCCGTAFLFSSMLLPVLPAQAQPIIPTTDGTGTQVILNGQRYDISGGSLSGDSANLFHSFQEFGLSPGEIANFLANPQLQNILGRVTGGNPSVINGLIQVTGGSPNLYLMNPAGMVFGPNASLNVPASFTATTADAIGFGNGQWFTASSSNAYSTLVGTPNQFAFTHLQPGSIINAGNLAVSSGRNLALLGGTVLNSGSLSAPNGNITIAAVPGGQTLRLSQTGMVLGLEVAPQSLSSGIQPIELPALLASPQIQNATGATVDANGTVILTGSGLPMAAGDVGIGGSLQAGNATLQASQNLTLVESQLSTTNNLNLFANNQVQVRDSVTTPFSAIAGGHLTIQGNQGIDILALNHLPEKPFQSGGNLTLISDGIISTDAHFASGGDFSLRTLQGETANFRSIHDPIFNVGGDFNVSDYTGASLQVTAGGNITYGTVVINAIDPAVHPTNPAFFLNAGNSIVGNGLVTTTISELLIDFQAVGNISIQGIISDGGTINIASQGGSIVAAGELDTSFFGVLDGGDINLTASNDISVQGINSFSDSGNGGDVAINAGRTVNLSLGFDTSSVFVQVVTAGGTFDLGLGFDASSVSGQGGSVIINAGEDITTPTGIDTTSVNNQAGDITIQSGGDIDAGSGFDSTSINGKAGNIAIKATGDINVGLGLVSNSDVDDGGDIDLTGKNIKVGYIFSNSFGSGKGGNITIDAEETFQAFLSCPSAFGCNAAPISAPFPVSISSGGVGGSGSILIRHGGGAFIIGDSTVNGTDAAISSFDFTFSPPKAVVGSLIEGNLEISSSSPAIEVLPLEPSTLEPEIEPLPSFDIDLLAEVEEFFTEEFEEHLELDDVPIKSLAKARATLKRIAQDPGIKPALIYAVFTPRMVLSNVLPANGNKFLPSKLASPPNREIWRFTSQGISTSEEDSLLQLNREPQDDDQLELILVTANGDVTRHVVPGASRAAVRREASKFSNQVSGAGNTNPLIISGKEIYQWLVAPLESELQANGVDNLVFILDESLRSLPLVAMHDGQGFIVERYSVGLMPSLSLTDTRYVDITDFPVLAMGASEFDGEESDLPAVPAELSVIADRLWQGSSFLNAGFTPERLVQARKSTPFALIHLATHASFRSGKPQNSYIRFWDRELPFDRMRQLQLYDPLTELLVLSACQTAIGDREAELGFAGLAVQTGAKSALGSLWSVEDAGTLGLMASFYEQLKEAPTKSEALRRAQLAMLHGKVRIESGQLVTDSGTFPLPPDLQSMRDRTLSHPYYWSAFTLVGNPW